eukprot:m.22096 g.22096  ORF g.22096 m.22096 type:complete len:298 (-) comp8351_c0_seq1:123-1016(-)
MAPVPVNGGESQPHDGGASQAFVEGVAGAKAMVVDIVLLMWLRTVMNHQFRYGGGTFSTIAKLYTQGGLPRLYQGFGFAMLEAPLSRGISTSANYLTLHHLSSMEWTRQMPLVAQTATSSLAVASFRLLYFPLDTAKTMMQVEGASGFSALRTKIRRSGVGVLYHGATSSIASAALKHTLWFSTFNYLNTLFPSDNHSSEHTMRRLMENSAIGFSCAVVTDVASNPLSVLKGYRQTHTTGIGYGAILRDVVGRHGLLHLFTRGLGTRLWVDAINSVLFTTIWRMFVENANANASSQP